MNKVGLIVTVNKYKNHFASSQSTVLCDTVDEARLELIKFMVAHLSLLNIDFPLDYDDFANIWFHQTYVMAEVFNYKVFTNNTWQEPWTHQEIYDDVLEAMYLHDTMNPPDFETMYGEPKYEDEEDEIHMKDKREQEKEKEKEDDNRFTSSNKAMKEVEEQMKQILKEAENAHIMENCNCTQCNETKELETFINNES